MLNMEELSTGENNHRQESNDRSAADERRILGLSVHVKSESCTSEACLPKRIPRIQRSDCAL
jgi:hypothetical protein